MNIKGKDNKRKIITEVKIFKNKTRNPRTESALSHLAVARGPVPDL